MCLGFEFPTKTKVDLYHPVQAGVVEPHSSKGLHSVREEAIHCALSETCTVFFKYSHLYSTRKYI